MFGNVAVPSDAYLLKKRVSVFNKPYEDSVQEIVEYFTPPKYEKTREQLERIVTILTKSFLTKHLSQQDMTILALAMTERAYNEGDMIITYGDVGQEYFILDKGAIDIIVYKEGTDPKDPDLA